MTNDTTNDTGKPSPLCRPCLLCVVLIVFQQFDNHTQLWYGIYVGISAAGVLPCLDQGHTLLFHEADVFLHPLDLQGYMVYTLTVLVQEFLPGTGTAYR